MPQRNKKTPRTTNQLRIIGGLNRGRKLSFPDGEGLRPTTDRIRETLFNWLQTSIAGAHCLDLFAGSGALGLEALSRGASSATFVDTNPRAIAFLAKNIDILGFENTALVKSSSLDWLAQTGTQLFDLVFVDPPFGQQMLEQSVQRLTKGSWLSDHAQIYLESELDLSEMTWPPMWQLVRHKRAGNVYYGLLSKQYE